MPKIGDYYAELGVKGLGNVTSAFASVRKGLTALASTAIAPITSLRASLTNLLNPLTMAGTALGALGVGAGVGGMLKLAADAEQTAVSFEVLLGSAEKAKALVEDLTKFGAATPFEVPGLSQAAKTLLNFGVAGDQVMGSLDMLSNVAMGNNEKLQALATVYGQIASTGRLTGGDLLQLINAGFNPLLTISQRTGRSMADLKKDMEKGLITFDMVKAAFQAETAEGGRFYQMNEKMSKTLGGLWSSASDAVTGVLRQIGEAMVEAFDLKGLVQRMADFAGSFQTTWVPTIKTAMGGISATVATAFNNWLPVARQCFSMLVAWWGVLWDVASSVLGAVGSLFRSFFSEGVGDIREWVMAFMTMLEFWFTNWKTYLAIAYERSVLFFTNTWERMKAFFQNGVILIQWLGENWWEILVTMARAVGTVFENIATNIATIIKNIPGLIRGTVSFAELWTPLLEGFESAVKEMPKFVDAAVKDSTPALDVLRDDLEKAREKFYGSKFAKPEADAETPVGAAAPKRPERPIAPGLSLPAAGAATGGGISFVGLADLANQMQQEAGKRVQEQIAAASQKTASAIEQVAKAAAGDVLRVQVVGGGGRATYA